MFGHLNDNFIRNGGDISSCQSAVGHMDRVADAGCDDLCVDIFCHVENVCDLTNQVNAVAGNIINSSEERRNVGCASPSCEKSLICRENQGHVGLDALGRKDFDCFQSLYGHGDLNYHVRMDGCNLTAFLDHSLSVGGGSFYLTADGAVHDRSDLFDHILKFSSALCDQGRVCGHAADHTHVVGFANLIYICCIYEKFHCFFLLDLGTVNF